ncbi:MULTISPECIES: ParB/RepB/Spo0J family partition protein [Limnospira]|jgi:ParB family chromosome partitioning protein|uniref:ParB-like partition protein n=1 Tax=Limnospira platensis NIES-46 TaxID=1236695 RepID=A0A5M3TES3_LIMPL|nr:ParB/RepB/Spo0J family partition protein [Arthrospira platensis]AMW31081.1 chromosome partitioning protein ParB [Arthrospira platensis YZ]KDR58586.1 plasmid partitioning protein ParB [Arthrospira platensis str. Paraca]MBD2671581.1 ParB/RepB/Spo0J family partition protein [Arthrospira platensis FACHB-439]MDF2208482.1 ParB/RepB/Spo0J family partition protein [Arthrospira platensis NCB002]MDT9185147.1 ParB/RepB/Spo0J family partition protein [Limnospira sp. PMC 289.06]MDT9312846.1 ParB/RepB/S
MKTLPNYQIRTFGDRRQIPIKQIVISKVQPRKYFSEQSINKLAASIKSSGILQDLIVRPIDKGKYELVAGERRYRAAQIVGLETIPAQVKEMSDAEALQCALTENIQREDLNPIEETEAILRLLAINLNDSVEKVRSLLHRMKNDAKKKVTTHSAMGKPEAEIVKSTFDSLGRMSWDSFVSNQLPMLKLPPEIMKALGEGEIDYTKAKEIAKLKSEKERLALLSEAIAQNLTLRQVQKLVRERKVSEMPDQLETEISDMTKQFRRSKARLSPQQRSEIEALLKQLKLLMSE